MDLSDQVRDELLRYFSQMEGLPGQGEGAKVAWRMSCFDSGRNYVQFVESHYFHISGKSVLDLACAWGGHAVAFASRGARVYATDKNDHEFPSLAKFSARQKLRMRILRAECERLPFPDSMFDVVLALELVEHIEAVGDFAREVARVLRPQGICLISTPARLRSLICGEPHYHLKGLAALPFPCQRIVATEIFGRNYPYPVTRQYSLASRVVKPFARQGLAGCPVLQGRPAKLLGGHSLTQRLARELFWSFVVVVKSSPI